MDNTMVSAARRVISKVGFRLFFGTLIMFTICYGAQFLIVALFDVPQTYDASFLIAILPQYVLAMPALILMLLWLPHKAPEKKSVNFGWFMIFFVIAYSLMTSSNYIATFLNLFINEITGVGNTSYAVQEYVQNSNIWLVTVFTVIIAPIYEEFIFRKLLIDRCGPYGQAVGALLSGWTFGLFHGNLTQAIYAFVLGYFLGIIYQKTGRIWVTIGLHMLINFMGSFVAVNVINLVDLDTLLNLETAEQITAFASEHALGLLVYMLYSTVIFGCLVAGIVLLIVNRRKFLPSKGALELPRHSTFKTTILNPGVIAYTVLMLIDVALNFVGLDWLITVIQNAINH